MPKITRHGGLSVEGVTSVHVQVLLPGVAQIIRGELVESETAGTGPAVNADTGEVTQPGEPLPVIGEQGPELYDVPPGTEIRPHEPQGGRT